MMYKSFLASLPLSEFVRNYIIIHLPFRPYEPNLSKQRSPKPEQKIVFYLKGLPAFYNPITGSSQTPPRVSILSHQRDPKTIRLASEFFAFIIFLKPGVLHRLIRLPMTDFPDAAIDAELFFGTEVRLVSEQLASATNHISMISIAEQFLLPKCTQLGTSNLIGMISLKILNDPTTFSLDLVAREACLSTKQFYRRFTEQIGISPKLFSRMSRFNHAYRYKLSHADMSWSAIAQEFCYTDYHHMEKEFKEFTGLTPHVWTNTHLSAPERILKLR
ncbi:MAG: AraC family transcriptional regulator [Chitinophagaceae bacterium]|nr:MAG: AraC family transcriptional regulator [Chitinophagaceae bacterium]